MTDLTIFVIGALVTLLMAGTVGLLVWAAIEDGRYNREVKRQQSANSAPSSIDPQNVQ